MFQVVQLGGRAPRQMPALWLLVTTCGIGRPVRTDAGAPAEASISEIGSSHCLWPRGLPSLKRTNTAKRTWVIPYFVR